MLIGPLYQLRFQCIIEERLELILKRFSLNFLIWFALWESIELTKGKTLLVKTFDSLTLVTFPSSNPYFDFPSFDQPNKIKFEVCMPLYVYFLILFSGSFMYIF